MGAEKGERTAGRQSYPSGYYGRTLITRVGKLELRVPQDRAGRFSTELFERYQRSERALVTALAEMYVQGSAFSNSNVALRVAPMRKIRLSRNADRTPIDIILPVNRCNTGVAFLKYVGNTPREPQQQRHADNVSRPAIKVPGDDDLDTTGDMNEEVNTISTSVIDISPLRRSSWVRSTRRARWYWCGGRLKDC